MLVGREKELYFLKEAYEKLTSNIVVLYGRTGIGKTSLVREFIADKDSFYYQAIPATKDEARFFMANSAYGTSEINNFLTSYDDIFAGIPRDELRKKIIVIDEFSHISRNDDDFMDSIQKMVTNTVDYGRVMVILISSSISYVEDNKKLFKDDLEDITIYKKLQALSFIDIIRFFSNHSIEDCIRFYGLTGGVPYYISRISKKQPFEENVCRNVLNPNSPLFMAGHDFIKEELRETGVYNTILGCLASGMNKINDIYGYTNFGRDKISVYLKNLMDRDIVEKLYSYDTSGKKSIKNGIYRIKPGFVAFWYRFMYAGITELIQKSPVEYYKENIQPELDVFMTDAFIGVCDQYIDLLEKHGKLAIEGMIKGRVYQSDRRIDIIREGKDKEFIVGNCYFENRKLDNNDLNVLINNIEKLEISPKVIYMFSSNGFESQLIKEADIRGNIKLVDISDL